MKKTISVLLKTITIFFTFCLLCACGNSENKTQTEKAKDGKTTWYLGENNGLATVDPKEIFKDVKDTIDPDKVYDSLTYTEKMFYGAYTLNDKEKDLKKVRKEISFEDVSFTNGSHNISVLPIAVCSGTDGIVSTEAGYSYADFQNVTDREVAVLEFATADKSGKVLCAYEVHGNKITYTELNQTNKEGEEFSYKVGEAVFEYEFSLKGPYLTLSKGKDSIKLTTYSLTEEKKDDLSLAGYSILETSLIDELDYFASAEAWNYAVKRDGSYYDKAVYKLCDDGRITIYLSDKDSKGNDHVFVEQYAYILISDGNSFLTSCSVILLDGEQEYYYTDTITQREARILSENGENADALSEDEIKEIAEKKSDLFDDLYKEFEAQGINVTINRSTGELAMDASVLFGGDSAVITDDGKQLLNKFLNAYTAIIYNDKYNGFVTKTRVEGHTAPVSGSTYESGLPLSEERANNVKNYCLSVEIGVDTSKLASTLEAVGLSNSKPVYDTNGNVDMAACRRVSFRFIVDINR